MDFNLFAFSNTAFVIPPFSWLGWIGFILTYLLVILSAVFLYLRQSQAIANQNPRDLAILIGLGLISAVLFQVTLSEGDIYDIPGFPGNLSLPSLTPLVHIPWLLALLTMGSAEALLVAFLTSTAVMLFNTHDIYTPACFIALVYAYDYFRARFHNTKWLPAPIAGLLPAAASSLVMVLVSAVFTVFMTAGKIISRIDYLAYHSMLAGLLIFIGLVIALMVIWALQKYRGLQIREPEIKSKAAGDKMAAKFFNRLLPLTALALVIVVGIIWFVSNQIARRIIDDKVENILSVSQNQLASFLETGQQNISQAAAAAEGTDLQRYLPGLLAASQSSTYFKNYVVFDPNIQPVVTLPDQTRKSEYYSSIETQAVKAALGGASFQVYTIPSIDSVSGRQFIFVRKISSQNLTLGVLLGYTDLRTNSIAKPVVDLLDELADTGATWHILDESGQLLLSSVADSNLIFSTNQSAADLLNDSETGKILYQRQVGGVNWTIQISVTADDTRRIAFTVATPLVLFLAGFLILLLFFWRFTLNSISKSIQSLASEANTISGGNLSNKLVIDREDEVGQLAGSLEVMRLKLKQRLDELGKVLSVSTSVAENLNFEEAIRPIIQNVLLEGVSFVRVCLDSSRMPGFERDVRHNYVSSKLAEQYAYLDTRLMELIQNKDYIEIPDCSRDRRLRYNPDATPGAIMVLPIHYKNEDYGVMWLGYSEPHNFSVEEIRYLNTMANQASLAASNASLFSSATMGRERLETVLKSIPDPVLVLDENNQLIMVNDAVIHQDLISSGVNLGVPLHKIITQPKLVEAILSASGKETDLEVKLDNGHTFNLMVTPLPGQGKKSGSICMLKDVTSYKEVDRMRMEFVTAVSQEFKSPLTLLKGYATMIDMVGQLNDRQKSYLQQMNTDIENLTNLVNNLLDLDRLNSGEELRLSAFSVNDLMEDLRRRYQAQMTQNKLDFRIDKLARDETMTADVDLINRALANLVEHAINNTPMNGVVSMGARLAGKNIEFIVADSGKGIAAIDLPHTFDRAVSSSGAGTGMHNNLGLSLVKSIIERHNGVIAVDSQLGRGSAFTASLPLKPSA